MKTWREMAAEALAQIRHPGNEGALPTIREVILKDANQTVRQRCVWALFNNTDLERHEPDPGPRPRSWKRKAMRASWCVTTQRPRAGPSH